MKKLFQNKFWIFAITLFFVVGIIVLNYFQIMDSVKDSLYFVLLPIQKISFKIGDSIAESFAILISIQDLNRENQKLSEEVRELTVKNVKTEELKRENQALKEALDFTEKEEARLIPGNISGLDPENPGDFVIIDKGREDGVEKDLAVIVSDGILIGRVIEVDKRSSKILLITNTESRVSGIVQDSRARGIVKGEHGLGLRMEMIPQNALLKAQDIVIFVFLPSLL